MADIEKVYSGLDKCNKCDYDDCTLHNASKAPWDCMAKDKLINDALELLKEQKEKIEDAYHKGYSDGYDAKAMEVEEDMH